MTDPIASLDQIAPGGILAVRSAGEDIALCRIDDTIYAVSRRCHHKGAFLDRGSLQGHIITCPLHFAQFDVRTGASLSPATPIDHTVNNGALLPAEDKDFPSLKIYPVELRGRDIYLLP